MRPLVLMVSGVLLLSAESPSSRTAVERSLPLLQKTGTVFWEKSGCIACHHHTLSALAVVRARERGFKIDEQAANDIQKITADYLRTRRDRILQGIAIPGAEDTMANVLWGLALEKYTGDEVTDAAARFLKFRQRVDGSFATRGHRPPMEFSHFTTTAISLKVLNTFAPPARRAEYLKSVAAGTRWLAKTAAPTTEEAAMKILGLVWGEAPRADVDAATRSLMATQRKDGGWSQIPTLDSDAYATGQALYAMYEGGVKTTDPVYERGVAWLLRTQLPDGSWLVKSRSDAFQPYFESGFPHGHDQWISAAGTGWATAALAVTSPKMNGGRLK